MAATIDCLLFSIEAYQNDKIHRKEMISIILIPRIYVCCAYLKCKMVLMMECSLALVHLINIYYLGPGNQLQAPRLFCLKLAFISHIIYLELK